MLYIQLHGILYIKHTVTDDKETVMLQKCDFMFENPYLNRSLLRPPPVSIAVSPTYDVRNALYKFLLFHFLLKNF